MEFLEEKGRIYAVDANGKLLAEVTFPDDGNTAVIDCHKNVNLWEQQVFMYKQ